MAKTLYRTIAEQVADHIRSDIFAGTLEENAFLKEQELSDRFGVSRGTIRHALMQLAVEGIVTSTPNVGMKVASHPTKDALNLIIGIRNHIEETVLAEVWDALRDQDNIETWSFILDDLKAAGEDDDIEAFMAADIRFHRFFVELYPDKHVTDLWDVARSRMMMRYNRLKDLGAGYEEHKAIFDAVEKNDLEAALGSLHKNVV